MIKRALVSGFPANMHFSWKGLSKSQKEMLIIRCKKVFKNRYKVSKTWLQEKIRSLMSNHRYFLYDKMRDALHLTWDGSNEQSQAIRRTRTPHRRSSRSPGAFYNFGRGSSRGSTSPQSPG
jgi:sRNA-binding protein